MFLDYLISSCHQLKRLSKLLACHTALSGPRRQVIKKFKQTKKCQVTFGVTRRMRIVNT